MAALSSPHHSPQVAKETMREKPSTSSSSGLTYDYADQVGHLLRRAYQRNLAIFQRHCIDPSLTSVQFVVLCVLMKHGPQSQASVGRLAAIDPSTTKGVIDRLRDRRLIELAPAKGDKRKTIVNISSSGRELYRKMSEPGLRITELTTKSLNPAERVALVYLLRKISDLSGVG